MFFRVRVWKARELASLVVGDGHVDDAAGEHV